MSPSSVDSQRESHSAPTWSRDGDAVPPVLVTAFFGGMMSPSSADNGDVVPPPVSDIEDNVPPNFFFNSCSRCVIR